MELPRQRFSERHALVPFEIQTDGLTAPLRHSIWNVISHITAEYSEVESYYAVQAVAARVLRVPVQAVPYGSSKRWLLERFGELTWPEVYDMLEYVVHDAVALSASKKTTHASAIAAANLVLQREHSGFRFVANELTRVIQPAEAQAVEESIARAAATGMDGVRQQIEQALALFGKRPDPDYRNAIKEAISAVEGTVKLIEGVRSGGLKEALDSLAKRLDIHAALREGLVKLYGFTSDEDGIRHPILDAPNVEEEDARFMIVTCSAAVNWIIAKAEKAGLLKKA